MISMKKAKTSITHFLYKLTYRFLKTSPWLENMVDHARALSDTEKILASPQIEWRARSEIARFGGRWIDSVETKPDNEKEIVDSAITSFNAAKRTQTSVPAPYRPSGVWEGFFDRRLGYFYQLISKREYENIAGFLRSFFRNEAISGLWRGEVNVFQAFCNLDEVAQSLRELAMKKQYLVWRRYLPSADPRELDAPRVGNPWGYRYDDHLLYEPVFEYNFQAHYFDELLSDIEKPVVIDIGGGFGGLAHQLLSRRPSIKYIGFDLPENVLLQTYYLACIFPNAKILTYQEDAPALTLEQLNNYDVVLLPNFELRRTDSLVADLIVNVRGLSTWSYETITEYLAQIDRIGCLFFYHENLSKARKDGLFVIPSTSFPSLRNFRQISMSESRWPNYKDSENYPCQENLFVRRSIISNHYSQRAKVKRALR
jgi:putative sugar O-methyltransferase